MKKFSLILGLIVACTPQKKLSKAPENLPKTIDSKFLEVAGQLPDFGGLYIDEQNQLVAYMTTEKKGGDINQIKKVLEKTFIGSDFLKLKMSLAKGNFRVTDLAKWRDALAEVLTIRGVVFLDLDEGVNRVTIGIENETPKKKIIQLIDKEKIPQDAVNFEIMTPIKPMQANLWSSVRPITGGMMIEADWTWPWSNRICTLGFNAIRDGVEGFITAAHCTGDIAEIDETEFHQPIEMTFNDDNFIGEELIDPPFFEHPLIPDREARLSDAAFIKYSTRAGRDIARTKGRNDTSNESFTLDPAINRFPITDLVVFSPRGAIIDKVGSTTSWTSGRISNTCVDQNPKDESYTLICQDIVMRSAPPPGVPPIIMGGSGDSGSPAFIFADPNARLVGLVWGADERRFSYSPIANIRFEIGKLDVVMSNSSSSTPLTGSICQVGQVCCESTVINSKPACLRCVSKQSECR